LLGATGADADCSAMRGFLLACGAASLAVSGSHAQAPAEVAASRTLILPILLYHLVSPEKPQWPSITRRLDVAPEEFRAQMLWLAHHRFHPVTQQQAYNALERGGRLPHRPVLITFDDGYRSVLTHAAPVLVHLHMPATAYVITGRVSAPDPSFLTWRDLRRLEQDHVEIGSHTVDHRPLTELSNTTILWELRSSRRVLERRLGVPVRWLAYPFGAFEGRVVTLAHRVGYRLATTTIPTRSQDGRHPLELGRVEILGTTTLSQFAAFLTGR
jgi:peptidoglycan/xylan/chitin deacetylase (PgdA/CDA1 family)